MLTPTTASRQLAISLDPQLWTSACPQQSNTLCDAHHSAHALSSNNTLTTKLSGAPQTSLELDSFAVRNECLGTVLCGGELVGETTIEHYRKECLWTHGMMHSHS